MCLYIYTLIRVTGFQSTQTQHRSPNCTAKHLSATSARSLLALRDPCFCWTSQQHIGRGLPMPLDATGSSPCYPRYSCRQQSMHGRFPRVKLSESNHSAIFFKCMLSAESHCAPTVSVATCSLLFRGRRWGCRRHRHPLIRGSFWLSHLHIDHHFLVRHICLLPLLGRLLDHLLRRLARLLPRLHRGHWLDRLRSLRSRCPLLLVLGPRQVSEQVRVLVHQLLGQLISRITAHQGFHTLIHRVNRCCFLGAHYWLGHLGLLHCLHWHSHWHRTR